MKAKTVNENIGFERNRNPRTSIGVGKLKEAVDILDTKLNGLSNQTGAKSIYSIEANSLDEIKIRVTPEAVKVIFNPDDKQFEWTIKYHQIPQYALRGKEPHRIAPGGENRRNWSINILEQRYFIDPGMIKIISRSLFDIDRGLENAEAIAEAALEGLNAKFPPIWVLETIDKKEL